ncbi:hypothetical protein H4R19_004518 [Coemansia spiralis]|nr:hypothetical protein H4R19_004518 [Coemansia spiralis]
MAGLFKNSPWSILVAWTGIIVVGFGTFAFAKDLVGNERRADNIRRIKRERRMLAYREYNEARDDEDAGAER